MDGIDKIILAILSGLLVASVALGVMDWADTGNYPADTARQIVITVLLMVIVVRKKGRRER